VPRVSLALNGSKVLGVREAIETTGAEIAVPARLLTWSEPPSSRHSRSWMRHCV